MHRRRIWEVERRTMKRELKKNERITEVSRIKDTRKNRKKWTVKKEKGKEIHKPVVVVAEEDDNEEEYEGGKEHKEEVKGKKM